MGFREGEAILLVEDEALIAMTEKRALGKYGYEVIIAASGDEAVRIAKEERRVSLILMDINLGKGIDGTRAAELILKEREIPVLFLSSHEGKEVVERTEKITSYGYVVKSSSITVLDASIKMAYKLFEAHKEIKAGADVLYNKNQVLESLMEHFPGSVFWKDRNSVYLGCNTAEAQSAGASSPGELIGKTDYDLKWIDHDAEFYRRTDRKVMESGKPLYHIEYSYHMGNGDLVWVDTSKVPIFDSDGGISGVFGVAIDVTERKKYEEALKESEYRLIRAERVARIGNWNYDPATREFICSKGACTLFGVDEDRLSFDAMKRLHLPEHRARWEEALADLAGDARLRDIQLLIRRGVDGAVRNMHLIAERDERTGAIWGVVEDTTESEAKYGRFVENASDEEKELILREVHHRIKNNMSTILSLLNLQAGRLKDSSAVEALEDAGRRVRSMMILYERLYQTESFGEISVKDYLPVLVMEIVANFPNRKGVRIESAVEDFILEARMLQPLGIIVNELISNIMKHAFYGRAEGLISISAATREDRVAIVIADDGVGIPEGVGFRDSAGFGLMLVDALARQLGGTLRIDRGEGTRIVLDFEKGYRR